MRRPSRRSKKQHSFPAPPANNLKLWVERVKNKEIPSFNEIIQDIISFTQEDACSASDLADLILKDVSMTTKVLRIANSFFFNPNNVPVTTVSRAVISIGFNTIKEISLAIVLIDHLAKGHNRQQLIEELARAIHAATQARSIAELYRDTPVEEVFIQTLLFKVGDLIFWSVAQEEGDALKYLMQKPEYRDNKKAAEILLLGFTLEQFGQSLSKEWKLSTAKDSDDSEQRIATIQLAYQVSTLAEAKGWQSQFMQSFIESICERASITDEALIDILRSNASSAANIAGNLGIRLKRVIEIIPVPEDQVDWNDARKDDNSYEHIIFPEPNSDLLLSLQREACEQIEYGDDLSMIIKTLLEAIYTGVGCDRAVYLQLKDQGQTLSASQAIGHDKGQLIKAFKFEKNSLFFHYLSEPHAVLLDKINESESHLEVSDVLSNILQNGSVLIAALTINNEPLGLFYSDCHLSKRIIDDESYNNFSYLIKQAAMGLSLVELQKNVK